jgi:hypothetical protein
MTQDQLCCITSNAVSPVYPREAWLAGIQGEVKLLLVVGEHNSIAELQAVSGDPLLVESTMAAVRQWQFMMVTDPPRLRLCSFLFEFVAKSLHARGVIGRKNFGRKVAHLVNLTDFDFGAAIEGSALEPFHRLFH